MTGAVLRFVNLVEPRVERLVGVLFSAAVGAAAFVARRGRHRSWRTRRAGTA